MQSSVIDVEDSMTAFLRELQSGRDPNGDQIQNSSSSSQPSRAKIGRASAAGLSTEDGASAFSGPERLS